MDYYSEVCDIFKKSKSKYNHFKSESHQELDKCKHIILSLKDIDINDVDEAFYLYNMELHKKMIIILWNANLNYFFLILKIVHISRLICLIIKQWFLGPIS